MVGEKGSLSFTEPLRCTSPKGERSPMNCHSQQAVGARHWHLPRTALIAFVTGVSLATPTSTRGLEAQESSPQGETIRLTAEIRDSRDNAALLGA